MNLSLNEIFISKEIIFINKIIYPYFKSNFVLINQLIPFQNVQKEFLTSVFGHKLPFAVFNCLRTEKSIKNLAPSLFFNFYDQILLKKANIELLLVIKTYN